MATTLEFIEEGNRTGRIFDRIRIKRKKGEGNEKNKVMLYKMY